MENDLYEKVIQQIQEKVAQREGSRASLRGEDVASSVSTKSHVRSMMN